MSFELSELLVGVYGKLSSPRVAVGEQGPLLSEPDYPDDSILLSSDIHQEDFL